MKLNTAVTREKKYTHEGAQAHQHANAAQELQRSVMACMLWENSFYERGVEITERIASLVPKVTPETVALMAVEAREKMKLRHVPLYLCVEMAKHNTHSPLVARTVERVIQRADELAEILSIYQRGRTGAKKLNKLSKPLQKGIAAAFRKFDEYALAKYNRDAEIKLRDAMFLCHPKPKDQDQAELWKRLAGGDLATPDTWEVALSAAEDKKAAWERLLREEKLFALALIRNLRNMTGAGVEKSLVSGQLKKADVSRVLPFRFVAAAKAAPEFESELDEMLMRRAAQMPKLHGKTVLVIDVSGSMYCHGNISSRSDITRVEAAGALAAIAREQCEEVSIYATAGDDYSRVHATKRVPNRHGMALVDVFKTRGSLELGGGGIFLTQCLQFVAEEENSHAERIIVFTDEQDCDLKLRPDAANAFGKKNYLVNISVERNGIGYGAKWIHLDGFSENVLQYIQASEQQG